MTSRTVDEHMALGKQLYGDDMYAWRFKCPCCGHVASTQDYKDAGAPEGAVGFSCIGRWAGMKREAFGGKGPGPCNYAGGGLFSVGPVKIGNDTYFDFADEQAGGAA